MLEEEEPDVLLLPDLEEVEDLAFVPVLPFALAVVEPEPVVDDLLLLPDEEDEVAAGRLEPDVPEPDFELVPVLPELPVLLLLIPVLFPIDDEFDEPDVLPDMLPELWFFSLSFIVKISWIYIV